MLLADIPANVTKKCKKISKICACKKGIATTVASSPKGQSTNLILLIIVILLLLLMFISMVFAYVIIRMVRRQTRQHHVPLTPQGRLENFVMFFVGHSPESMMPDDAGPSKEPPPQPPPSPPPPSPPPPSPPPTPPKPTSQDSKVMPQDYKVIPCGTDGRRCDISLCVIEPVPPVPSRDTAEEKHESPDEETEQKDLNEDKKGTGKENENIHCGKGGCNVGNPKDCTCGED